ncbi:MAG TPA: flavin reductase family protein [Dongiaceae bacterium]|nr:flavin reductase family protein [Dongiaceae bacterium]
MFYETRRDDHGLPRDPFKSLIVPRPIGWISTVSRAGIVNLAPYSFFNAVAENPPIVGFGPGGRKSDQPFKDSRANVEATGEFVCNLATYPLREAMNATSASLPHGVDELALAGLTPAPSRLVKPPRVKESPVHFECRYLQTVELPSNDPDEPNALVLGEVIGIHIDDAMLQDGRVDVLKLQPIARLGYAEYTVVDSKFAMRRPD